MKEKITIKKVDQSRLPQLDFNNIPFGQVFSDHMFVVDYKDGEWKDARIEPFGPMYMHPATMSLHYGQAIFEGMKAFKTDEGQPVFFRPEMHAKRINASAERLSMPALPEALFLDGLHQLINLDQGWIPTMPGGSLYIRPFMFATDEFIGVRPSESYKFIIFTCPVGPYYDRPVSLKADLKYVRAVPGGTGEAKAAGNYAGSLLPATLAREEGYDQVMWMDGKMFRYVQEVGTMNIFFVVGDQVWTPMTDGAILKGITRDSILTLLKDKRIKAVEKMVDIQELMTAYEAGDFKEAFGAGTAAVIASISKIAYRDVIMNFKPQQPGDLSVELKKEIEGIRAGTVADKFDWIVPVNVMSTSRI